MSETKVKVIKASEAEAKVAELTKKEDTQIKERTPKEIRFALYGVKED